MASAPPAPLPTEPAAVPAVPLRRKLAWIAAIYFASGFPFGFLNNLVPVYLGRAGVDEEQVGRLLSLVALAYTAKPAWSPLLDWVGTRKGWMVGCQLGIAVLVASLAAGGSAAPASALWAAFVAVAVLSATQDISVDAYTIELLAEREMGPASGVRVASYRAALVAAGGLLVTAAGEVGWPPVFVASGAIMLAFAAASLLAPPADVAHSSASRRREPIWQPVRELLRLPAVWAVAVFVLTFKLGDLALQPMVQQFWVHSGYSDREIGLVLGTVGVGATVVGALAGGALTARLGTFRALWMLGAVQALSNLGYFVAAAAGAPPALTYAAAVVEQFTGGLGTAAFLTFLMALCDKRYAATQYAVLSAIFRLGGVIVTWFSGTAVRTLGYAEYFLLTFALALPAFALLPVVRRPLTYASPASAPPPAA